MLPWLSSCTAFFASFNVGVACFFHGLEEGVLEYAVGGDEDGFAGFGEHGLSAFVYSLLGVPFFASADLHDGFFYGADEGFVFTAFTPEDLLFYYGNVDHMEMIVVHILVKTKRYLIFQTVSGKFSRIVS